MCKELIQRDYEMTLEEAALLFEQLWIQAYGLGSMCAEIVNLTCYEKEEKDKK